MLFSLDKVDTTCQYTNFIFGVFYSWKLMIYSNLIQVMNVLLRFAWLQTILNFKFSFLHRQAMVSIAASLEIIRRGMWSFFR